jgi:hypothetical protein
MLPFCACCTLNLLPQVLKGAIDFKSEPWPKISEAAKDCVKKLLEMDPAKRATSEQVGCAACYLCSSTNTAPCVQPQPTVSYVSGFSVQIVNHDWPLLMCVFCVCCVCCACLRVQILKQTFCCSCACAVPAWTLQIPQHDSLVRQGVCCDLEPRLADIQLSVCYLPACGCRS